MVGEVFAGIGGFKAMMDIAKMLIGANQTAAVNAAVIDLQSKILSAQEEYSTLLGKVAELETEVARLKAWDGEKQRYELKKQGDTEVLAYTLKEGVEPAEPAHSICPDCYQRRQKSLLQKETRGHGQEIALTCQVCGWEGYLWGYPPTGGNRRRRG